MSPKAQHTPGPWEVVEGAPNGEAWVCAYAPITHGGYDEAPEQEDTRLFAAPPSIAAEVVRRWNAHEELVDAARMAQENLDASLRGARPPHNDLKVANALRAALAAARGGK